MSVVCVASAMLAFQFAFGVGEDFRVAPVEPDGPSIPWGESRAGGGGIKVFEAPVLASDVEFTPDSTTTWLNITITVKDKFYSTGGVFHELTHVWVSHGYGLANRPDRSPVAAIYQTIGKNPMNDFETRYAVPYKAGEKSFWVCVEQQFAPPVHGVTTARAFLEWQIPATTNITRCFEVEWIPGSYSAIKYPDQSDVVIVSAMFNPDDPTDWLKGEIQVPKTFTDAVGVVHTLSRVIVWDGTALNNRPDLRTVMSPPLLSIPEAGGTFKKPILLHVPMDERGWICVEQTFSPPLNGRTTSRSLMEWQNPDSEVGNARFIMVQPFIP